MNFRPFYPQPSSSDPISRQAAIASPSPQSVPTRPAPLWGSLLIGTLLTVATPTAAAPQSQTAAVTNWSNPATGYSVSQSMPEPTPQSMSGSMPHSMSDSTADPTADPATSFQRINQPLGIKALVTIGGLVLMAGELWWFLGHHVKSDT